MNIENKEELEIKMADCCFEISEIISNIQKEVSIMMSDKNINWGHLGSLNHVKDELRQTLIFLRGKAK